MGGERRDADGADRDRDRHGQPDPEEEAVRQRLPRLARLGGEIGHRLEAGIGEHRHGQREEEGVPGRCDADVDAAYERAGREEEGEADDDDQQVGEECEPGRKPGHPAEDATVMLLRSGRS